MTTISVIVGSTRQGRFSGKPAQWILQHLRKRDGTDAKLLDLRDFPMPFFDQPMPPAIPGRPPYQNEVVLLTWGASAAQFFLPIALVWMAAHESTPSGRLPKETVYSAAVAALLVVVALTVSTFSVSPVGSTLRVAGVLRVVPPWIMDLACGVGGTVAGGTLVLLFSWVFRNSLATRPTVAGALYGAGAALAINAGWRIACPYPTLRHALRAHGAAIVATVLLGAVIGRFLGARRFHSADGSG